MVSDRSAVTDSEVAGTRCDFVGWVTVKRFNKSMPAI